jgi:hypothetical protein
MANPQHASSRHSSAARAAAPRSSMYKGAPAPGGGSGGGKQQHAAKRMFNTLFFVPITALAVAAKARASAVSVWSTATVSAR